MGNEFQVDLQVCQITKQIPKCFTYALEHTIDALGGDHVYEEEEEDEEDDMEER